MLVCAVAILLSVGAPAAAATIVFNADPFEGSTAPGTPGRQIVGGEPFLSVDFSTDVFQFDTEFFAIGPTINLVNDVEANIPATGVNVVILRSFGPPMAAGIAADLIAARITQPGPGLFMYFNTGLNVPRLVYSADLSVNDADLKILARFTNLTGATGQAAMATVTADNFELVPEPSLVLLLGAGLGSLALARRRGRPIR
jgi:hypothetical protein